MKPEFHIHGDSFIVTHYNQAAPFANFLPALAGVTGKPMWAFYTNRGQGLCSFGVHNKDGAMLEFLPANKAYQSVPVVGFRTFIKMLKKQGAIYEPFSMAEQQNQQTFTVRPYEFEIKERNQKLGLEVSVVYFGVPSEAYPALARRLTIKNISSHPVSFQVVDGLPRVVPFGMNDYLVKHMSRTIEAFTEVLNLDQSAPLIKLKVEPDDRPDVKWIDCGFFSLSFAGRQILPVIVDPRLIFGENTSFLYPTEFAEKSSFNLKQQLASNIMPSSFSAATMTLKSQEASSVDSYFGYADNVPSVNNYVSTVKGNPEYFNAKRAEMKRLYEDLVNRLGFWGADPVLNQYARVTFMDNVLRGGYPESITPSGPLVHVYSRKHGDMERDYNAFHVSATYYSQGNGNFRDVNQNRRHDLFLNPGVGTANVDFFFNLLQLDGFNPLIINPTKFLIPKDIISRLRLQMTRECQNDLRFMMSNAVLAGNVYEFIKKHTADPLNISNDFREIMGASVPQISVQHGEGYWIDHWIYNLDHLEQYLLIFPEKKQWLLFEKEDFTYHDSDHVVRPRREKFIITPEGKLRQFGAVAVHAQKKELIASRQKDANKVRAENGQGEIFKTNLFIKLIGLAAVKLSSLDPYGAGLEMEADKPGWCDALNGAPGLLGSSTHEMYQLHRLVKFLLTEAIPVSPNKGIDIPQEIYLLIREVEAALALATPKDFRVAWDRLASARESFREKTLLGVSGKLRNVKIHDLKKFLERASATLVESERKSFDSKTGLPTSYFTYFVETGALDDGWRQHLYKLPWKQTRVAPFLEGAVHAMRMSSPGKARQLYNAVRRSALLDKSLGMYKLNAPLSGEARELGRVHIFERGWLENESIFLHMHYKYLLEILRSGLTETFFREIETGWVPFRDPRSYGRSVFENSSFIASSAFPNPAYHGKGFVARLSGATSEFLSMVYLLAFGRHVFRPVEGGIVFSPEPQLPKDWFTKEETPSHPKNSLSLRLFGVPITFLNPGRKNTFGAGAAKPAEFEWILDGRFYHHAGRHLTPEASAALREGRLENLSVILK